MKRIEGVPEENGVLGERTIGVKDFERRGNLSRQDL